MGATAPADAVSVVKLFEFVSLKDGELSRELAGGEPAGGIPKVLLGELLGMPLRELSKVLASRRLLDGSAGTGV